MAHNLACDHTPENTFFLIANARLDANLNHRKESPLKISNRKWMPFSRIDAPSTSSVPFAAQHAFPPWRPLVTHHSLALRRPAADVGPLATALLIYGTAIRNAPKALRT